VKSSLHDTAQDVAAKFGDSSRLNNPTNYTYGFKNRDGSVGLLEVVGYAENSSGVKIRYKLAEPTTNRLIQTRGVTKESRELLSARMEAASSMINYDAKDKSLALIAADAARAGDAEIANTSCAQIINGTARDTAMHETALLLAKSGLRKQAIELAKGINNYTLRDQALSELAQ
jgi:hypothetical protein